MNEQEIKRKLADWKTLIADYQRPDSWKATWQIINTLGPFVAVWVLMYFSLQWSYWITLGLALFNGLLMARIFIIQHDCGHNSFFGNKRANHIVGYVCSFFSTIPYKYWSKVHNYHHGHSGQLDHGARDIGDVPFLTVEEYRQKGFWGKLGYRVLRLPPVLFVVVPIWYLAVVMRLPTIKTRTAKKAYASQLRNNLALGAVYTAFILWLGWKFLLIQLPIWLIFGTVAFWFFYVQHQHEETYKRWREDWDYLVASICGSTYYKLPAFFNWMTGSIGYHHIHHLSAAIPNYNLSRCARDLPVLQEYVTTLNFRESLRCMFNKLYDEQQQRMVSFREYRKRKLKRE